MNEPKLITAATFQPFEVEEIKLRPQVRGLADPNDDAVLLAAMQSAIEEYQWYTGHILCSSVWDAYLDEWPDDYIELPAPLVSVSSINYRDSAGTWQITTAADYAVDISSPVRGRVTLAYGKSWSSIYDEVGSIRIRFVAGYPDAESIPYRVKDGLMYKIQELYDGIDRTMLYRACWGADARLAV